MIASDKCPIFKVYESSYYPPHVPSIKYSEHCRKGSGVVQLTVLALTMILPFTVLYSISLTALYSMVLPVLYCMPFTVFFDLFTNTFFTKTTQ